MIHHINMKSNCSVLPTIGAFKFALDTWTCTF